MTTWLTRLGYDLLWLCLLPILMLRLLWRSRRTPDYRRQLGLRLGRLPKDGRAWPQGMLWLHCVSVGELLAALPMLRHLLAQSLEPILITTTTPTAKALLEQHLPQALQQQLYWTYLPWDFRPMIGAWLRRLRPRQALLFETEIWPNLLACAQAQGLPCCLLNGRLSAKSLKGYQRLAWLTRPTLASLTQVAAQTPADAQRLIQAGAQAERVQSLGNLKFDIELSSKDLELGQGLAQQLQGRSLVWLAASTHAGEESTLLAAHQHLLQQLPDACLLLAPRHPERSASLQARISALGLSLSLRSQTPSSQAITSQVHLIDSLGELRGLFGGCHLAYIGGSLVNKGGQSPIEACLWRKPMLMGPSRRNFAGICAELSQAGALVRVEDAQQLAKHLLHWHQQPDQRQQAGQAGWQVSRNNQGSLARQLALVKPANPAAIATQGS